MTARKSPPKNSDTGSSPHSQWTVGKNLMGRCFEIEILPITQSGRTRYKWIVRDLDRKVIVSTGLRDTFSAASAKAWSAQGRIGT